MPAPIRPRRSVLFMPGSNPRALEKARALPADGLIFDLEDAVAPEAKETARAAAAPATPPAGTPPRGLVWGVTRTATGGGNAVLPPPRPLQTLPYFLPKFGAPAGW